MDFLSVPDTVFYFNASPALSDQIDRTDVIDEIDEINEIDEIDEIDEMDQIDQIDDPPVRKITPVSRPLAAAR